MHRADFKHPVVEQYRIHRITELSHRERHRAVNKWIRDMVKEHDHKFVLVDSDTIAFNLGVFVTFITYYIED